MLPTDQPRLSPYLIVSAAAKALEFYCTVLGARELFRLVGPDGRVGHAEMDIGGSRFLLADEYPDFGALSPRTVGGTPVTLHLYVEDVDAVALAAVAAGAVLLRPVHDEFFGDRVALFVDPFGHKWHIATRIEEVSPEEMQRRWDAAMTG